jgi:hypothetical protein
MSLLPLASVSGLCGAEMLAAESTISPGSTVDAADWLSALAAFPNCKGSARACDYGSASFLILGSARHKVLMLDDAWASHWADH